MYYIIYHSVVPSVNEVEFKQLFDDLYTLFVHTFIETEMGTPSPHIHTFRLVALYGKLSNKFLTEIQVVSSDRNSLVIFFPSLYTN